MYVIHKIYSKLLPFWSHIFRKTVENKPIMNHIFSSVKKEYDKRKHSQFNDTMYRHSQSAIDWCEVYTHTVSIIPLFALRIHLVHQSIVIWLFCNDGSLNVVVALKNGMQSERWRCQQQQLATVRKKIAWNYA